MIDKELLEQFQGLKDIMVQGFAAMNQRMDALERRQDTLGQKVDVLEQKIDSLEKRQDAFEQRILGEFTQFKAEMQGEFAQFKTEMQGEFTQFKEDVYAELQKQTDTLDEKISGMDKQMRQMQHELKVYMEVAVGGRMAALFDGYEIERDKLAHLEKDTQRITRKLDDFGVRLAVLESKFTA